MGKRELSLSGKRPVGYPRLRWVHSIQRDARDLGLEITWMENVTNRVGWRGLVVLALSSRAQCGQSMSVSKYLIFLVLYF